MHHWYCLAIGYLSLDQFLDDILLHQISISPRHDHKNLKNHLTETLIDSYYRCSFLKWCPGSWQWWNTSTLGCKLPALGCPSIGVKGFKNLPLPHTKPWLLSKRFNQLRNMPWLNCLPNILFVQILCLATASHPERYHYLMTSCLMW